MSHNGLCGDLDAIALKEGVHFTLMQNMLVMVPGEMWDFKGRIFGAGTM